MAAAWAALEAAGRVARPERLQREATGGGGALERRVGASARRSNGREDSPRRRRRRCRWAAARNRAGRWEKEIRVVLQFLKIPGTSL